MMRPCKTLLLSAVLAVGLGPVAAVAQDQAVPDDTVLAIVNGTQITEAELRLAFDNLPAQYAQMPYDALRRPLLEQLVDRVLVNDAARAEGFDQRPEIAQELSFLSENALRDAYLYEQIELATTDEKLRARYDADVSTVTPAEEVNARHILLETEEAAVAAKARADGGEDFVELAKELSTGPSGPDGGSLGYFTKERMVPPFAEAAFAMQPGEISEPVQTQFGWHVIKVEDRRMQEVPGFDEVKESLQQQVARETITGYVQQLRSGGDVELTDAAPVAGAGDGAAASDGSASTSN